MKKAVLPMVCIAFAILACGILWHSSQSRHSTFRHARAARQRIASFLKQTYLWRAIDAPRQKAADIARVQAELLFKVENNPDLTRYTKTGTHDRLTAWCKANGGKVLISDASTGQWVSISGHPLIKGRATFADWKPTGELKISMSFTDTLWTIVCLPDEKRVVDVR